MRLKVCGMTGIAQLKELETIGVDFAGLIFYPQSPRYAMKFGLTPELLKQEKLRINRVGVFVNEEQDTVLRTVDKWKLDMVQLHGDESPRYCEHISNHVNTIKAFRIGENENVPYKTFPFIDVVDLYLFDTMGKQYGGTGEQFQWELLCHAPVPKPYFLSGGIGPEDVDQLSQFCENEKKLFAIDVNSKFEQSPGVKDMNKVKDFFNAIKMIN